MVYENKLSNHATEATTNIFCPKGEGAFDHHIVTRVFKKFHLRYKNLVDQASLGSPKIINSKAVL